MTEKPRSPNYLKAVEIIEEGIRRSTEGGWPKLKVELWVKDSTNENGGYMSRISLGQFFGGNKLRHMVSDEEYRELYEIYGNRSLEYEQERAKSLGAIAAGQSGVYESGHKRYRDIQSARAGDALDD
jgi:hypothetical protein